MSKKEIQNNPTETLIGGVIMPRKAIDKETRRALNDARHLIEDVMRMDGNEAETRRRVERIFEKVMGYDVLKHLSRERAVRGAGETEHVDFALQLEPGEDAKSIMMVELKRVGVDLALKHLKQVASYAIDAGCEWTLLTNGREWRLYHVEFGQPPETTLLEQWDLLKDDPVVLAERFETISYKKVKKGSLDELWRKTKVLAKENLLMSIFSPEAIRLTCRMLRNSTGVRVASDDVFSGMSKLLNESAAIELSALKVTPVEKRRSKQKVQKKQGEIAKSEESVEKTEQEKNQVSNNPI
ncbi:MAG: type I restriction enzyme HsdR N-terminal domain-containing protein [Candidatus Brocadiales bacterium]